MSSVTMAKKVGDALVQAGLLKERDLKTAADKAKKTNTSLIISLLDLDLLKFKTLEKFAVKYLNIKSAIIAGHDLNADLVLKIGAPLITSHFILPLSIREEGAKKVLSLGMVDPTDSDIVQKIERRLSLKIIPFLISLPDFKEILRKSRSRIPSLEEINLEVEVTEHSFVIVPDEKESTNIKKEINIKESDLLGLQGRKFREEVLAKLDLDPSELLHLSLSHYTRLTLTSHLEKVNPTQFEKIFNEASENIKIEGLLNLLIVKGIITKQEALIATSVSSVFSEEKK